MPVVPVKSAVDCRQTLTSIHRRSCADTSHVIIVFAKALAVISHVRCLLNIPCQQHLLDSFPLRVETTVNEEVSIEVMSDMGSGVTTEASENAERGPDVAQEVVARVTPCGFCACMVLVAVGRECLMNARWILSEASDFPFGF